MSVANSNNYDGRKYSFCPFEGGKGERYAEFDNDLRAHATSMPLDRDDDCDFEMALLGTDPGSLNHDGGAAANVRDPNALAAAPKRRWKSKQRQLYALYWKHVLIPSIRTRFKNECRNEGQRCFAIMEQEFRKVPDELDLSALKAIITNSTIPPRCVPTCSTTPRSWRSSCSRPPSRRTRLHSACSPTW